MGFQDKDKRPPFKKPISPLQAGEECTHLYDNYAKGRVTHFDGRLPYVSWEGKKAIPCIAEELVRIETKKADELEDMGMDWNGEDERKWART